MLRLVSTLLHMDGTDGSTNFVDSSQYVKTFTRYGSAQIKTNNYKFGGSAGYFNGTTDYISTPNHNDITFGTYNFTIDFWIKRDRIGIAEYVLGQTNSTITSSSTSYYMQIQSNGTIEFRVFYGSGSPITIASTNTIADTNWHHIAIVRNGTNLYLFVDGIQWGTAVIGANAIINSTYQLSIGRFGEYTSGYFQGYIDEFRIVKYKAEYTANFIPPTSAYNEIIMALQNGLPLKSSLSSMQIGDAISCQYTAPTSGAFGAFLELGTSVATPIPVASSATPNGSFNFIHSGFDTKGRMKLIADRNIQSSIAWDTLNSIGVASGSGIKNPMGIISTDRNSGLNNNVTHTTLSPKFVVYNNELYCSWQEYNGTVYQIRVKKYDGTTWSFVDGNGANGLNYDITKTVGSPSLITYNNELYCSWAETNGTASQIRVKKYDGTTWTWVDGGEVNSINYDVTKGAYNPMLNTYNNELYCSWIEANASASQIRVKKYNGTTWSFVDGNGVNGLNYNVTKGVSNPVLLVYNNELYCSWYELNSNSIYQIRVKKYNGTSWIFVDGGGTNGINYDVTKNATSPSLAVYSNELYCTWYEHNGSYNQIRVKKYNGSTWTFVDGGGTNGLNYSTIEESLLPNIVVYNNELYCSWYELNSNSIYQIRVKKYNGTTWSFVDGNGANGINYDVTKNATSSFLITYNNELYCSWQESNGTVNQIRVKKIGYMFINPTITGIQTSLRLLSGGTSATDLDDEWDKIIVLSNLNSNIVAGDNNVWNWNGIYSWTSTTQIGSQNKVKRGNASVNVFTASSSDSASVSTGFRPMLLVDLPITKYLIQDGTTLKTISGSDLSQVANTTDSVDTQVNAFLNNGMDNFTTWSTSLLSQISGNEFSVLMYKELPL